MFLVDQLILLGGVLLLLGIVSSKVSARVGLPVLVLFLIVGMLAGEDGIGRIEFDDFVVAHAIGTVALAVILFDGGLQTRASALAVAGKPAAVLATVGVAITAAVGSPPRPSWGCRRSPGCCSAASSRPPMRRRCSRCCGRRACNCRRGWRRCWRSRAARTIRWRSS
jgi:hypothetical protein